MRRFALQLRTALATVLLLAGLGLADAVEAQTTYNVGCSVAALKTAIDDANVDGTDSVLELAAGCDYLLTALDNTDSGNQGLPTVDVDGTFRINGNGATIRRDANLACDTNDGSNDASEFGMFAAADGVDLTLHDLTARDFCSTISGGVVRGMGVLGLTVTDSRFESNQANGTAGVFKGQGVFTASVSDTDFIGNRADDDGGAMEATFFTLTVARSNFIGNSSDRRGGALRGSEATFTIEDCTFRDNTADLYEGGAILVYSDSLVNVAGTTFENNSAATDGGAIRLYANAGPITTNVLNSTFVGNRAGSGDGVTGVGGAIGSTGDATSNIVNITHSTFLDNTDDNNHTFSLPTAWAGTLTNSIVDNGANPICDNAFDAGQDNLLSDSTCDPPARGLPFNLGAPTGLATTLAFNSGATDTLALLPGSNAIDAASQCIAVSDGDNPLFGDGDPVAADQRGLSRPFDEPDAAGSGCDIGAFEWTDADANDLDDGIEACCWIFGDGFEDGTTDAW